MIHRCKVMLALAAYAIAAIIAQSSFAQTRLGAARSNGPVTPKHQQYLAQMPSAHAGNRHLAVENTPASVYPSSSGYVDEGFPHGDYADGGYCSDGCCDSYGGWDDGCCNTCGGYGCDGACRYRGGLGLNLMGWVCPPGRYFFTADYLYTRANFSEAIAFLEQNDDIVQGVGTDTFHELDFHYESSYRFGGGYRLCNCCEEVRFLFTRLSSFADDVAPFGSFVPYEVAPPPGGQTFIRADADAKSYDLEFAKTIPLGGRSACDCGDPCGCGDGCGSCCPAWDVTWSGGLRFADVSWNRAFTAVDTDEFVTTEAISVMDFRGGGVRVGLEGRRYFFPNGCLSVYLKGDLSLLLGDVELAATRTFDDPTTPDPVDLLNTQTFESRQIIPVTEIEAGLTGHITCNTSLTTGYLFSAWHDLGFRDEFNFPTLMETHYDDGNILGFDGFFARLEVAY